MKHFRIVTILAILSSIFNQALFGSLTAKAATGTLTALTDTATRIQKGVNSSHVIKFTTSVAISQSGDTIAITFPSDFNLTSSAITDITFTHGASTGAESTETLAATASATAWGAAFSGTQSRILTLTAPTDGIGLAAVAANDKVIITYASTHLVNAGTAGSYTVYVNIAGANTAAGSMNVVIVDKDQIGVTASVDAALTFSISQTSIGFGNFVGTATRYATTNGIGSATEPASGNPTTLSATSNGINGLTISIRDEGNATDPGLFASAVSELIPAAASTAVTTGSKKYGVYGKNASTLTIAEGFDNDTTADVAISRNAQTFATYNAPGGGSVDVSLIAAVDATTKAGAYADTLTVICTGNY